jgi:hypothetical protein
MGRTLGRLAYSAGVYFGRARRRLGWVQRLSGVIFITLTDGTTQAVYLMNYILPDEGQDALERFEGEYVWPAVLRAGYDPAEVVEWRFGRALPDPGSY